METQFAKGGGEVNRAGIAEERGWEAIAWRSLRNVGQKHHAESLGNAARRSRNQNIAFLLLARGAPISVSACHWSTAPRH